MRKDVVIYRKNKNDLLNAFTEIVSSLEGAKIDRSRDKLVIDRSRISVKFNDWSIEFFCGIVLRMGGTRPFLYNTNCKYASNFLEQGAVKVDGKEVKDLKELLRIICEWEGENNNVN